MPLTVLWSSRFNAAHAQNLIPLLSPDITLLVESDRDKLSPYLNDIDLLIDGQPTEAMLDAPHLKHLLVPWAGIPPEVRQGVLKRPHLRLYNSHYNAAFVAYHAVALLLACACRLIEADQALRRGDWGPRYDQAFTSLYLPGQTCLLLGYGAIGREAARLLRGLGLKLTALKRHATSPDAWLEEVFTPPQLHEALASADAVVVSLPHTPATEGLLDAKAFAAMKPGSLLVNVGRGPVIDQHALYAALTDGTLAAAGLDVWWRYPENEAARSHTFPADAPLHELPNVVLSPHRSNAVRGETAALLHDIAATLNALARGEARNQVNPQHGY
ncbi:MAG: hypothetical protein KGZ35_04465 [Truepera sp.]|nr:hypothetical protein [Truepera sp.]